MSLSIDQLNAVTTKYIQDYVADNYFQSQALLYHLKKKGVMLDGGTKITFPVVNTAFTSVGSFSGTDTWSAPSYEQVLTSAEFDWKEVRTSYAISQRDLLLNSSSKQGIVNLAKAYAEVAKMTLIDQISTELQGDGTTNSSKVFTGLGATLSASSTYGGIAVADMTTWAAKIGTLTNAGELTLADMQRQWGTQTVGNDMPNLLLSNQSVFDKHVGLLDQNKRFVNTDVADGGFRSLTFNGAPHIVDNHVTGSGSGTADNWLEFLNTKWLTLYLHSMDNFVTVPVPIQTTSRTKFYHLFVTGNLTCNNRRMQGAIKTINPAL